MKKITTGRSSHGELQPDGSYDDIWRHYKIIKHQDLLSGKIKKSMEFPYNGVTEKKMALFFTFHIGNSRNFFVFIFLKLPSEDQTDFIEAIK